MRPTKDEHFLELAQVIGKRATCLRRSVGCVLVNGLGHIIATGYNGVAAGVPHCNKAEYETEDVFGEIPIFTHACEGASAPTGQSLDKCEAIHAEQNALLQCSNTQDIYACYVTVSPCILCIKMLMNTSCSRVVFSSEYIQTQSKDLWVNSREARTWELQTS